MFNARVPLLLAALATGVWGVSHGSAQWQVVIQVVCAVVVSVSIFLAVLAMADSEVLVRDSSSNHNANTAPPQWRLRYSQTNGPSIGVASSQAH